MPGEFMECGPMGELMTENGEVRPFIGELKVLIGEWREPEGPMEVGLSKDGCIPRWEPVLPACPCLFLPSPPENLSSLRHCFFTSDVELQCGATGCGRSSLMGKQCRITAGYKGLCPNPRDTTSFFQHQMSYLSRIKYLEYSAFLVNH
ncbi:hypothetical protein AMECASPLE_011848 [Ameca splendens]|uniref:Uncharacterized protein n=1 Tax=Ameca splendens TaxID=208324 RepID=A0ABV1A9U4_9TELE